MSVPVPQPPSSRTLPAAPAKAARNVFWLVFEKSLRVVGGVGMGVLIARHLGPEIYGKYGAAIGVATLAKEAVMLGFDRMIRRDLAAQPERAGQLIGTSVTLGLVLAFAAGLALTWLSGPLVGDEQTRQLTLIVLWMGLPQAFFACEIWFESQGRTRNLVWARNCVWGLSILLRVGLVIGDATVLAFAIVALAEWALTYLAVLWLLRRERHLPGMRLSFDRWQLLEWFKEGWPAVLMVICASLAGRLMVLIVHNLATLQEAGYMNAALRLVELWWSIASIIAAVLLPRIVKLQRQDARVFQEATQLYANASLLLSLGAAVFVTLTAPLAIPWMFGEAYRPSAYVLVVLFWSGPATFPAIARSQLWVTSKRLILDLPTVLVVSAVQLAGAFALTPRLGALGAATAITGAQWIGVYLLPLLFPTLRRASAAQYRSWLSVVRPWTTLRGLSAFARGAVR